MEITFEQYQSAIHEYIYNYCARKGFAENSTVKRKIEIFNRLAEFLDGNPFNPKTVEQFQDYLYAHGWEKASSKATLANWLRAFVKWGFRYAELFEKDWSYRIIKPKVPKKKWHLLSEENALKVIEEGCVPNSFDNQRIRLAKDEHALALKFMLLHGCRVGEVIAMRGSDLRLDAPEPYVILRQPKSREEEWQPIHPFFIPILRERINNERLFRFTEKTANKLLKRGAERLGLKGYDNTCHRLRDIYSLARLRKHPGQLVSRSLRHDSYKTTDEHYSHYSLADIAPVVEDSGVLQPQLTPQAFAEKAVKALKIAGLYRPEQYQYRIIKNGNKVRIEAIFRETEKI